MPEWLRRIINSKSKTFLTFCFCFIFGIAVFSFAGTNKLIFSLYILFLTTIFFLILCWKNSKQRFLLLCFLIFISGGLRFLITISNHDSTRIEFYNGQKVNLRGWVSAEPNIGLSNAKYIVNVESLTDNKKQTPVSGKIYFKNRLYPQYSYGEELDISCALQEPENFADSNFNFKNYLARQGIWSVCSNPKINPTGVNKGNFLFKKMFWFKSLVQDQMSRLWPEPANSLMAGLLYGSRSGMPQNLIDNFTRTGVSHIIAVSGYNVSIIVAILNVCLIYIGLSRRQSFWFLMSLIFSFVFFTGATASVVRAGVMASIILVAGYWGRLSSVGRTLIYAAVIMLLFNPYVLIWDAGFQLSFLSTMGLVYLSPILESVIFKRVKPKDSSLLKPFLEILITTMSAIFATLPIILFHFGRLSLVAPLVNILVLWLVPWLMLFGFLALILSWLFFPLGQVLAWVAGLGLNYVIIIVDWFGNKSWSAIDISLPLWAMILIYLGLILYVKKNQSPLV
jgi:competence protein ComEC